MASSIATAYIRLLPDATGIVDSVNKELNNSSMATASKNTGKKIADGLTTASAKLMPVSLGLTAIGVAGVKSFAEVDKTMVLANKTMGNTAEEAQMLDKAMQTAASNSVFGMSDAANAVLNFARAGLDADQAASALAPTMALAAGEGGDLDIVSAGLVGTINSFHGSFDEASRYTDIFAAACNNSALNVDSLLSNVSTAAPIFATAGYNVQDLALAMGVMANNNIEASVASTSLKTGLARLASPAKEGAAALESLGFRSNDTSAAMEKLQKAENTRDEKAMSLYAKQLKYTETVEKYGETSSQAASAKASLVKAENDYNSAVMAVDVLQQSVNGNMTSYGELLVDNNGEMRSFDQVVWMLHDAFSGLSETEQMAAASAIFGKNQMSPWLALINTSSEDVWDLDASLSGSSKSITDFAVKLQNHGTTLNDINGRMEALGISTDDVEWAFKTCGGSAQNFVERLDENSVASYKEITDALGISMDELQVAMDETIGTTEEMAGAMMSGFGGSIEQVKSGLDVLVWNIGNALAPTILKGIDFIQGLVDKFNALSPAQQENIVKFGAIVAASGPLLGAFGNVIKGVEGISKAYKVLKGIDVASHFSKILLAGNNLADAITNNVGRAFQWFSSQSTAWGVQIGALGTAAIGVADAILVAYDVNKLQEAWSTYHEALLTHNKEAEQALSNYAKLYEEKGKEVADQWAQMVYQIDTSGMEMDEAQKAIAAKVETYWDDVPTNMWDGFKQGWDHYFGSGEGGGIIGLGKDAFTGLVNSVKGFLGINSPSKVFQDIGSNTSLGYYQGFDSEWAKTVLGNVKNLIAQFPQVFKSLTGTITNVGKEIVGGLSKGISGAWNSVSSTVSGIVQKIPQFFSNLPQNLSNVGQNIMGKLSSGMSAAWSKGSSFLSKIGTSIGNAFSKVPASMQTIGSNISTGLSNGISKGSQYVSEGMKKISEFIRNFASGLDKAKDQMVTIGGNLLTGLRNGIVQKANEALGAVKQAATNVVNTVKGVFGVHSPSKVFEEIGENLMEGLAVGIDENGDTVETAITALSKNGKDAWGVGEEIFTALVSGVDNGAISLNDSLEGARKFVQQFTDSFKALEDHMGVIGHNLMVSLANGIAKGASEAASAMSSAISLVSSAAGSSSKSSTKASKSRTKTTTAAAKVLTSGSGTTSGTIIGNTQKMIDDGTAKTGTITGEIIGRTEQMIRDAQTATGTLKGIITEEYEAIQTAAEDMQPRASSVVYEPYKSPVQQASAAETIVSALGEQLSKIKVVLDDGTLVGHMTPGINRELGTMTYNQRREVLA